MVSKTEKCNFSLYSLKSYLVNTYYGKIAHTDEDLNKEITYLLKLSQEDMEYVEWLKCKGFRNIMEGLVGIKKIYQIKNGKDVIKQEDYREENEGLKIYNYLMQYYAQNIVKYIQKKATNKKFDWEDEYTEEEMFGLEIYDHLCQLDEQNKDDPLYICNVLKILSSNPIEYLKILRILLIYENSVELKSFLLIRIPNITNIESLFIRKFISSKNTKIFCNTLFNMTTMKPYINKQWMLDICNTEEEKKEVNIAYEKDVAPKEINKETHYHYIELKRRIEQENINEVYEMAEQQAKKKEKEKKNKKQKKNEEPFPTELKQKEAKEKILTEIKGAEEKDQKEVEKTSQKDHEEKIKKKAIKKESEEEDDDKKNEDKEAKEGVPEEEVEIEEEKAEKNKANYIIQDIKEKRRKRGIRTSFLNIKKKIFNDNKKTHASIKQMKSDIEKLQDDNVKMKQQIDEHQKKFDKMTIRGVLVNIARYLEQEKETLIDDNQISRYDSFITQIYTYKAQLNKEIHTPPKQLFEVVNLNIQEVLKEDKTNLYSIFTSLIPMFEKKKFVNYITNYHWKNQMFFQKYKKIKNSKVLLRNN